MVRYGRLKLLVVKWAKRFSMEWMRNGRDWNHQQNREMNERWQNGQMEKLISIMQLNLTEDSPKIREKFNSNCLRLRLCLAGTDGLMVVCIVLYVFY
jgi:hypothetical protein